MEQHSAGGVFNLERVTILLDTFSFFLVTPEFLGPDRLEVLEGWMRKFGVLGLRRIKKTERFLKRILPFNWGVLLRFVGAVVVLFYVYEYWVGLPHSHPMRWPFLFSIGILTLLFVIPVSLYLAARLLQSKILSSALSHLASRDVLRFSVFAAGTGAFLLGRILAWLAHGPAQ